MDKLLHSLKSLSRQNIIASYVLTNIAFTLQMNSVIPLIKGEQISLTKLQSIADENKIKKVILLKVC